MTKRVVLHVGAPKSGTTYLQRVLEANRERLADAGVLVVGREHVDRVHAGFVIREDPRLEKLPERAHRSWERLIAEIRAFDGELAVFSYELLAGASAEQARRAREALGDVEVDVVITARDLALAVPSAWQERLKFGLTTPLEEWQPKPETAVRAEWGWRTMDPAGVAARWGEGLPPERVHVVTAPREGDRTELWHRFATACRIDVPGLELAPEAANESLGVAAAALLRRVNEVVGDPITGNREHALWLRDTLAHGVLAPLDDEPIGLTDDQHDEAARRAAECTATLAERGYDLVGDPDDLAATRREARTPGQVSDTEVLDVAVRALVGLLVRVREVSRAGERGAPGPAPEPTPAPAPAPAPAPGGAVATAKGLLRRVVSRRVETEMADAERRIGALEAQLREARHLQVRVAQLADVVDELLLPAQARDAGRTAEALAQYRRESL